MKMHLTLAELEKPRETFPALLDRLHREGFTGEHLLCWAQGYPKAVKFFDTTVIRLDTGREKA